MILNLCIISINTVLLR